MIIFMITQRPMELRTMLGSIRSIMARVYGPGNYPISQAQFIDNAATAMCPVDGNGHYSLQCWHNLMRKGFKACGDMPSLLCACEDF